MTASTEELRERVAAVLYEQFEDAEYSEWLEAPSEIRAFCYTLASVALEEIEDGAR